ncbi:MAG: hypothetical protein JWQ88_1117 [Rhodoferax sp.]|nr:hypothetical protein [Rhodoferax sp.]
MPLNADAPVTNTPASEAQGPGKGQIFLPTLRRQSLLMAVLGALFAALLTVSLVDTMRDTASQWLGVVALCVALPSLWFVARMVRQAISRAPVLRVDAAGIDSPQLPPPLRPLPWEALDDVTLDRAQGGQLHLVLRPDPARPDRRAFLSGRNPSRPVIGMHMLTSDQQDEALQAIHTRLAPLRAASGRGEAASVVEARAAAAFDSELDRLTPRTWALYLMCGLNVAVWLAQVLSGMSPTLPLPAQLHVWGANSAASVVIDREYWRLMTAPFLHGGAAHLGFNMLALWAAGRQLSRLLGNTQFLFVYLATALCGSVASLHYAGQSSVSVGASGAVFGVLGALLAASWQYRHRLPPHDNRRLWCGLGLFVVYSLMHGFTQSNVDNAAHVGGLLAGLVLGLLLKGRFEQGEAIAIAVVGAGHKAGPGSADVGRRYVALAGVLVAGATGFGIMATPVPAVWPGALYEAQETLRVVAPQFRQVFAGLEAAAQRRQTGQMRRQQYFLYIEQVAAPQCRRLSAQLAVLRAPQWEPVGQAAYLYRRMCDVMVASSVLEMRKAREGAYAPADIDLRLRALGDELAALGRRLAALPRPKPGAGVANER